MSVTDFECAIAKSQIGRYIAGENLAPEVSRQLETHISACPRCKQLLIEKKSSLEAVLSQTPTTEDAVPLSIPTESIPMTVGNVALKAESMAVKVPTPELMIEDSEAESTRLSLREKLRMQAKARKESDPDVIELPTVAPAFAHKDVPTDSVQLRLEKQEKPAKKKGFTLASLALFKKVDVEEEQPAMTIENLRSAKQALKNNDSGIKKPMMYLGGLCVVVAAMSFVLKDPTALLGGKANEQDLLVKKPAKKAPIKSANSKTSAKKTKKVPTTPTTLIHDSGTMAQGFAATAPQKLVPVKPKTTVYAATGTKPTVKKPVTPVVTKTKKPIVKKTSANDTVPTETMAKKVVRSHKADSKANPTKLKTSKTTSKRHSSDKKVTRTSPRQNVVRLYTADETPVHKEQK
jgi:hypothetical protein